MTRSRRRLTIAIVAVVALVPVALVAVLYMANGSSNSPSADRRLVPTDPATQTEPVPAPVAAPRGSAKGGREIFLGQGCGNCHTLAAAGTSGTIGPVLDGRTPNYERFLEQVTEGGGGMPSFAGAISPTEIEDVVAFVLAAVEP